MKKITSLVIAIIALGALQSFASDAFENAFSIKDVEKAPVPVEQQGPAITDDIKGVNGVVHITFVIAPNGTVAEPKVLKSTDSRLDTAAINSVAKWTFQAAENQGTKVAVRAIVPIRFS